MVHSDHSPTPKHHMASTQQSTHQSIKQNKYSTKKPKTSKLKKRVTDREQRRERERERESIPIQQSSPPWLGSRREASSSAAQVQSRPGVRR
jgi:hypothetical protein